MPTGRKPTCICGQCRKCKHRIRARERYQAMTPEQRRAFVSARDKEKVRAADRARYYRDWEKRRAASDAYQRENRDAVKEAKRRWLERNPEKREAHLVVGNALRSGALARQPCEECGHEKTDAHHDDYTKPLDVRWLCRRCHMKAHRRYAA